MGINLGSFIAPLLTGLLARDHNWHLGFGIGGLGMLVALLIFRVLAVPQLQTFNELRQENDNWNKPVIQNKNAPKIAFSFYYLLQSLLFLPYLVSFISIRSR